MCRVVGQDNYTLNNETIHYTENHKHSTAWALWNKGVLKEISLANRLASTDNLTSNNKDRTHTNTNKC